MSMFPCPVQRYDSSRTDSHQRGQPSHQTTKPSPISLALCSPVQIITPNAQQLHRGQVLGVVLLKSSQVASSRDCPSPTTTIREDECSSRRRTSPVGGRSPSPSAIKNPGAGAAKLCDQGKAEGTPQAAIPPALHVECRNLGGIPGADSRGRRGNRCIHPCIRLRVPDLSPAVVRPSVPDELRPQLLSGMSHRSLQQKHFLSPLSALQSSLPGPQSRVRCPECALP